jgi:hypothetical protein
MSFVDLLNALFTVLRLLPLGCCGNTDRYKSNDPFPFLFDFIGFSRMTAQRGCRLVFISETKENTRLLYYWCVGLGVQGGEEGFDHDRM